VEAPCTRLDGPRTTLYARSAADIMFCRSAARVLAEKRKREMNTWFEVDKQGLAKLLERRGKEFALFELVQNAWDERGVTKVKVSLEYRGWNRARLMVEDDAPEGFRDLGHAFTLFAESEKKANPEQRGRFNLGEKLVLALCEEVTIQTTQGGLRFDEKGRHRLRITRAAGSRIECLVRMSAEECSVVESSIKRLIPPEAVATVFNGAVIQRPVSLEEIKAVLRTELAGEDGALRRADRETTVRLYEVRPGERATVYEMGIPVVETGDKWHCDVGQKIPLTLDRENVLPAFLAQLRLAVFNRMHGRVTADDMNSEWIEATIGSADCSREAVTSYMDARFGSKRVSFDPSDAEANKLAVSKGYTVVHGAMMSAGAWKNAKAANAILPAGQVTPGPKTWSGEDDPNATAFTDWIPESEWTDGMRRIASFAALAAERVLKRSIAVKFCATAHHLGAASFGPAGNLVFNKLRLGADWFERGITEEFVGVLIHELAHGVSVDHLSAEYHEALCRIGAKLFALARRGDLG